MVRESSNNIFERAVEQYNIDDLPEGEVLVRVYYSSLNYKDALSASGNRGVTKKYPHIPGIDAAGIVAASSDSSIPEGMEVIVSGYDLGMNTSGGFGQYIRVPADWVMARPQSLTLQQAMQIGTAGFTAAQCVSALIDQGVQRGDGPILVTGATGGVGSVAVTLLARLGYLVTAVSGKEQEFSFLERLGADTCLHREQLAKGSERLLLRERWAGVVDTVGGEILASAIKATRYDGTVTCCGNAMSGDLPLNVYPFILRGVRLIGIDSAQCPMERRKKIWQNMDEHWNLSLLNDMSRTISLQELDSCIDEMLQGRSKGRTVVQLQEET